MSTMISVKYIHPNKNNPRHEAGNVTELARSIESEGLLEPILVRPAELNEVELSLSHLQQYVLEDGFRRFTAFRARYGNESKIECHIVRPPKGFSSLQRALTIGLATDVHKTKLNPMERALAYGRMRDDLGMTLAQISKAVGIATSSVSNSLLLLELAPKSQAAVAKGTLTVKDAENAVKNTRAKTRAAHGKKPVEVGWEPEHFTVNHIMAKKAQTMCKAREHTGRRKLGNVACGNCWETVIRLDQDKVTKAELTGAGLIIPKSVFTEPILVPTETTASGNGRVPLPASEQ